MGAGDVCGQRAPEEGEARLPVERGLTTSPGHCPDVSDPDRAGPQGNTRDRTIRLTAIRADRELLGAVYQNHRPGVQCFPGYAARAAFNADVVESQAVRLG